MMQRKLKLKDDRSPTPASALHLCLPRLYNQEGKFVSPYQNEKPHLSPSQLDMYCRCGEAYRRRYMEKEIIPPAVAMLRGTAVHAGAETNFKQKVRSHEDLPVKTIVDIAAAKFTERLYAEGVQLTGDEVQEGVKAVCARALDETAKLAKLHAEQAAPEYQPTHVEEFVRLSLPGHYDMLGVIDVLDDKKRITDHKTSGKKKNQDEVDNSTQLTYYAAAGRKLLGEPVSEVRLDCLITTATPSRQVLKSTREKRDFQVLAARINAVAQGVQAGNFPPAPQGAGIWWCSGRFCGYHSTCPYVNANRKSE